MRGRAHTHTRILNRPPISRSLMLTLAEKVKAAFILLFFLINWFVRKATVSGAT